THHAEADRVFRWSQAVLFAVTPEKYQMTELMPYYRLAARYGLPALYAMNKCEERAVVEDYRQLLRSQGLAARSSGNGAPAEPAVFVVARDDAAFEPEPAENLTALRSAVMSLEPPGATAATEGLRN